VNLLIFDECHHAKKNHAYARYEPRIFDQKTISANFSSIMRDFYVPLEEAKRPRIFGMTASPVDARVDVVKAARYVHQLYVSHVAKSITE